MKNIRLLFPVLFLAIFSASGQSSDVGWASFYQEGHTDFSPAFREEMARQLMQKFDLMLEIPDFARDKEFMLLVGLTPLKTSYKDGYAFSLVDVVGRNAQSTTITIYWKAADNQAITRQKTIATGEVEFGWCADFDKNYFLAFAKENHVPEINGEKLKFDFVFHPELFPDLFITYRFKQQLSESELEELRFFLQSIYKEAYVSGIDKEGDSYSSLIDFQSDDFEQGVKQMENFALALNRSRFAAKIELLKIE